MSARYLTAQVIDDLTSRLTSRDLAILKSVSDLRFVTGGQLTRLHFAESSDPAANARAARRALLRLVRLDCLARLPRQVGGVRSGSAGFVYYLGLAGQRLAALRGWQSKRPRRRSAPGSLFLAHTLQVAELHTRLVEADRSGRLDLLELSAEPACWRSYGSGSTRREATLKPDSFVRLGLREYEFSYFIEVDRGTEGSWALRAKLRDYLNYEASGVEQAERGVFPKTLWTVPDTRRAGVIEDCIDGLPHAARELFQVALFKDAVESIDNPQSD